MELKVGETKTVKLLFILKAQDFWCEKNGLRLERSNGSICLYVNNGNRRVRYCAMPLGSARNLKGFEYTVKAQSKTRMLFSVGAVKFVIDYAAKKVATNLVGYLVSGSEEWGTNCQIPWSAEYLPLFGIPMPPAEMDRTIAELFWKWFWENETAIVKLAGGSRKEAKLLASQIELWLCPTFLYEKGANINFKVVCNEKENVFYFYHGGHEQLKTDAEAFGAMMHEKLKDHWKFVLEE